MGSCSVGPRHDLMIQQLVVATDVTTMALQLSEPGSTKAASTCSFISSASPCTGKAIRGRHGKEQDSRRMCCGVQPMA